MPELDTTIHLEMLKSGKLQHPGQKYYGAHWGDPDKEPYLKPIVEHFIRPYVEPKHSCVEIGPGGGRWTQYLLGFKKVYAVDYHQELLDELARAIKAANVVPIKNNGSDFPGVPQHSVNFLFSFGVFVHLDVDVIYDYLENMKGILASDARVFLQYSDKTKPRARDNKGFSINNPKIMRAIVRDLGYEILEEDTKLLSHSSIILFR